MKKKGNKIIKIRKTGLRIKTLISFALRIKLEARDKIQETRYALTGTSKIQ
ncbi:MAG: hypothetical protein KAJ66_03085 [Candidatus Omnitrophica bacterium]|nr:hypothetical protein [Candidatus Omnitrophota bacterium]